MKKLSTREKERIAKAEEKFYENLKERLQLLLFTVSFFLVLIISFVTTQSKELEYTKIFILLGFLLGLFNINKDEEKDYAIFSILFLLSFFLLKELASFPESLDKIIDIFTNFSIVVASSGITIGFLTIVTKLQMKETSKLQNKIDLQKELDLQDSPIYVVWDSIMFASILLLILIFTLDMFTNLSIIYESNFSMSYNILNVLFILDLIVIYSRKKSIQRLFRENLLDIVGAIPFYSLFRIMKAFKLLKLFKGLKLLRFLKFHGFLKSLPDSSSYSRIIYKKKK